MSRSGGEGAKLLELSDTARGRESCTSSVDEGSAVCSKVKHAPIIQSSQCTPRHSPKRNESPYSNKHTCMNIHGSLICNSHKLETTQVCINRQMDKLWHSRTMDSAAGSRGYCQELLKIMMLNERQTRVPMV